MASLNELRNPVPTNGSVSAFSLPTSIGVKRGPQGIPTVQTLQNPSLHNRVKEPMVNSTAAHPYLIRKYSREYEKFFKQGDLMFVRVDDAMDFNMSRGVYDFANLQLLNHILKKNAGDDDKAAKAELAKYKFVGIMENKMETGRGMDDMILINVRGRSRCCNMWCKEGSKQLKKGTVVYLCMELHETPENEVLSDPLGYRDGGSVQANKFHYKVVCSTEKTDKCSEMVPVGIVSMNNRPHCPNQKTVLDAHHRFDSYRQLMNNHPIEIFMRV